MQKPPSGDVFSYRAAADLADGFRKIPEIGRITYGSPFALPTTYSVRMVPYDPLTRACRRANFALGSKPR